MAEGVWSETLQDFVIGSAPDLAEGPLPNVPERVLLPEFVGMDVALRANVRNSDAGVVGTAAPGAPKEGVKATSYPLSNIRRG